MVPPFSTAHNQDQLTTALTANGNKVYSVTLHTLVLYRRDSYPRATPSLPIAHPQQKTVTLQFLSDDSDF